MNYVIKNGDIYTPEDIIDKGLLVLKGRKIHRILYPDSIDQWNIDGDYTVIDAQGDVVVPGFIDLHIHGGAGADTTDSTVEDIRKIADFHLQNGTTGLLLSTMSGSSRDDLKQQVNLISQTMEYCDSILGIHLEGPYLNPDYSGMYPSSTFRLPDVNEIKELMDISFNNIRMITIAPELEGALDLIGWCAGHGIVPSLGHSKADYELILKSIALGLSHVTHIFNAMPALHHRDPGAVGAALMDDRLSVQVICDGIHLHPLIIKMIVRLKNCHNICLVTDAMRAAGMPEGTYNLGKFMKVEYKNGCIRSQEGGLASTPMTMIESFKNLIAFGDISFSQAIQAVSATPAKVLGIADITGSISEGYDADILILDRELNIKNIFLKGEQVL